MQDLTGHKHLAKLKEGLRDLFSEISENRLMEGLMFNAIFAQQKYEKGRNHLFDEIVETNDEANDFTEEDLKVEENESEVAPPRKHTLLKSTHKQEDMLNPYMNPNLDADLSETIGKVGKLRGHHKQIQSF